MNTNLMDTKPVGNPCNYKKLLIKNNEQFAKQYPNNKSFENRAKQGDIKRALELLDKAL